MPRPARYEQAKMNFDPMTDTITNVAGAMIRLVILVLVITTPTGLISIPNWWTAPPPNYNPKGPNGSKGKPVGPLLVNLETLKAAIRDLESKTSVIERELPALQERVQKLRQPVGSKSGGTQTRADPAKLEPLWPDDNRRVASAPPADRGGRP